MDKSTVPVHAISLGCPKNRVDTEKFLQNLEVPVRLCANLEEARLLVLNTCAFIEPATRESIRTLLELEEIIKTRPEKPLLVVMGCLPSRYPAQELAREFPEVSFWIKHPDDEKTIRKISGVLRSAAIGSVQKTDFGKRAYAYVKIAEGCNHACTFCAIPQFKGKYHSSPLESVLEDARNLLGEGVKEIILVAQDLLSWGQDLKTPATFAQLLEKLLALDGLVWLRLLYLYPALITREFLEFMTGQGLPLLPYFDVPFQHSEMKILERMGRPFRKDPRIVIDRIRQYLPEAAIRTTLITGFPGESERDFQNLCRFVEESRFAHLGVFAFHAEDGTVAAQLPDQIPMHVREDRRDILMKLQATISEDWLANFCGRQMQVLVDESASDEWPGLFRGRVWFQAPEIDGLTYISGPGLNIGQMREADITDTSVYDLSALAPEP